MNSYELSLKIAELATDKKGLDIKIADLRGFNSNLDYFVLISGTVDQHVKALSEYIRKQLSKEGIKPSGYEGASNSKWILLDYIDVVVHIFDQPTRKIYNLEHLNPAIKIEDYNEE